MSVICIYYPNTDDTELIGISYNLGFHSMDISDINDLRLFLHNIFPFYCKIYI